MPAEITLLVTHVIIAFTLSGLVSGVLSTMFKRLAKFKGRELTGNEKFFVTVAVSIIVSFGYTMFYAELPLNESIAVFIILALSPSAFYEVFVDKGQTKYIELEEKPVLILDSESIKVEFENEKEGN